MELDKEKRNRKRLRSIKLNLQATTYIGIVVSILMYVERMVFVANMPIEYVGLYGVFQNIFNFLAIADFGVNSALTYCLYEPLAHDRYSVVFALYRYIRKIFYLLGAIICLGGLICCWKIDFFVRPEDMVPNIRLFFLMFMLAQASTYFCYSKAIIIDADQRQYITIFAVQGGNCVQLILQIIFVYFTKNYFIYLLIIIIVNFVKYLSVDRIAVKEYPNIFKAGFSKKENVPIDIARRLKGNIFPMFLHKLGKTVITSTDTILLSMLFGTALVGKYNNYVLLSNGFMTVFWLVSKAITSSIGDICVNQEEETVEIYNQIFFGNFALSVLSGILFTLIAQPFIILSFGSVNLISFSLVYTLGFNLFINSLRIVNSTFRDAMGLFSPDWYKPILEGLFNIVVSYLLALVIGPVGVILGTTLTYLCISIWIEPFVIIRVGFKRKLSKYYFLMILYIIVYSVLSLFSLWIVKTLSVKSIILQLCVNILIGIGVSFFGLMLFLPFSKSARQTFTNFKNILLKRNKSEIR